MAKRIKKKDLEVNEAKVIKAPDSTEGITNSVFLAGSIDMGKAVDWQSEMADKCKGTNVTLLNPRRDELEKGTIPSHITYDEYIKKYFLVKEEFRPKDD